MKTEFSNATFGENHYPDLLTRWITYKLHERVQRASYEGPLDAQREACGAYVTSYRHAGWIAFPEMYDDGGSMERPALKRLREDIKASKAQTVIVYKVDRLTRSLSDFAKIVDVCPTSRSTPRIASTIAWSLLQRAKRS